MKFAHISDLHLGKKLSNFDMMDDQRHILDQIADIIQRESVDALLVAGDIYDRRIPSEDAVRLFSDFLTRLSREDVPVYISAGNHDSGTRLDYCSGILDDNDIHISGEFTGKAERFVFTKGPETVNIYLLPFIRPYTVGLVCDVDVSGLDQAVEVVMDRSDIDPDAVNILVAHQFVRDIAGTELIEGSEDLRPRVGGTDMLASDMLGDFDYVALGHLHVPQNVGGEHIRYCGSPLKYSESEARVDKSLTIIDIAGKDDITVSTIPLEPLRGLRTITGSIEEVLSFGPSDDYIYVELDELGENVEGRLRKTFPRLCNVRFAPLEAPKTVSRISMDEAREGSIDELFMRFYKETTNTELTESQTELLREAMGGGSE